MKKLPLPISVDSIRALGAPYTPLDGMNEHGLAVSALTANGSCSFEEVNKVSLNDVSLIRMVLDKARNVNEEICKELLEKILEIEIEKVEMVQEQKTIDLLLESKGIRLDVYVKDENNTIYNVEMQRGKHKNLPKRLRYYQ